MKILQSQKGFSLVELLTVTAIIAILGAVAVTGYVGSTLKAARSEAYSNLEALRMHEAQFFSERAFYTADMNNFPSFTPGPDAQYAYAVITGVALPPPPVAIPYDGATVGGNCFVATATGIAGTRVNGDVFAIDCRNNSNF